MIDNYYKTSNPQTFHTFDSLDEEDRVKAYTRARRVQPRGRLAVWKRTRGYDVGDVVCIGHAPRVSAIMASGTKWSCYSCGQAWITDLAS